MSLALLSLGFGSLALVLDLSLMFWSRRLMRANRELVRVNELLRESYLGLRDGYDAMQRENAVLKGEVAFLSSPDARWL